MNIKQEVWNQEMWIWCVFLFQWFDHDTPESEAFPMQYNERLSPFQKLMLLRCFRVDRIYRAVMEFVTTAMGEKYVTPPIISFEAVFDQSTPTSPIVFILSPGSDPASDLMKLAERIDFGSNKLKFLSMGQGQEKVQFFCFCPLLVFRCVCVCVRVCVCACVCVCARMQLCVFCLSVTGDN